MIWGCHKGVFSVIAEGRLLQMRVGTGKEVQ